MARTKKAATSDAPAVLALGGYEPPPKLRTVWVHKRNVAAVQNRVGFVQVTRAEAQALVTAGNAVFAPGSEPYPYIEGTEPRGYPPPPPPVPDGTVVVTFTAFSGADPTQAFASADEIALLNVGDEMSLDQLTGTLLNALAQPTTVVAKINETSVTLDVDLTGANTAGVTARGTVTTPAPAPAPSPSPAPAPEPEGEPDA
jgi:hypothetical protein